MNGERRLNAPSGEKVLGQKHEALEATIDDVWYVVRDLRRKRGQKRFSLLQGCSYDGDGDHIRMIEAYGNLDILLQGTETMMPRLKKLAEEICDEDLDDAQRDALVAAITTAPGEGVKPAAAHQLRE